MEHIRAIESFRNIVVGHIISPSNGRAFSTAISRPKIHRTHTRLHTRCQRLRTPPEPQNPAKISQLIHRFASSTSSTPAKLHKTPLYELHVANGAKMVPFGGFHMPVQYDSLSISASHLFTRSHASLFDVSHMVQHRFSGPGAADLLRRVTPSSLTDLGLHESALSMLLWPSTGGIVDDTMITRLGPETFYLVTNSACRDKDIKFLTDELVAFRTAGGADVEWSVLNWWGLIALQGPLSAEILESVLADPKKANLKEMYFGHSQFLELSCKGGELSSPLLVSRSGYTGEDGFEISIPPEETVRVTEALLQSAGPKRLQLAGLGARDSLRLEAGMCLYGHDLNDETTPVEAGLSFTIGKERRTEWGFNGANVISKQLIPKTKGGQGTEIRRVGLIVEQAPAREGAEILDKKGAKIGTVTSGCPSPTLGKNIAMGYVKDSFRKAGTAVDVVVRGKKREAQISQLPFVPAKYWKKPDPTK